MPEQVTQGDHRYEFTLIWMKAQPILAAFINSVVYDRHHAEDILQKVALTAVERFEDYDTTRPFSAWAMGIARNHVLKYLRSQSRDTHIFDDSILESIASVHEELRPEYEASQQALERCLQKLRNAQHRAYKIIEMSYLRNHKPMEIAERLGTTANAIRISLHRIRTTLRRCITQQLNEDRA